MARVAEAENKIAGPKDPPSLSAVKVPKLYGLKAPSLLASLDPYKECKMQPPVELHGLPCLKYPNLLVYTSPAAIGALSL